MKGSVETIDKNLHQVCSGRFELDGMPLLLGQFRERSDTAGAFRY